MSAHDLFSPPTAFPFYHYTRPSFIPHLSDTALSLLAPFIAYWAYSLFFHVLDIMEWPWLEKYRLHESKEITVRNRATRMDVVRAVLVQQSVQSVVGWAYLVWEGKNETVHSYADDMRGVDALISQLVLLVFGHARGRAVLAQSGARLVYFAYWWAIPVLQFLWAMAVLDTWQYFLHRYFHYNKWLYRHIHSVHHRLYVPYAFGSLYNHPLEGFLLDTLGSAVAHAASLMTIRQAIVFFTLSTLKTVDDHCGYALPFDPLQFLFGNNADYHDIHHQMAGIKSNFSQPWFVHWDVLLGTRMRRKDIGYRKRETKPQEKQE